MTDQPDPLKGADLHHRNCRKRIYDPFSSPCTCESEYDRDEAETTAQTATLEARCQALEAEKAELIQLIQRGMTGWDSIDMSLAERITGESVEDREKIVASELEEALDYLREIAVALELPPETVTIASCRHIAHHAKTTHDALVTTQEALTNSRKFTQAAGDAAVANLQRAETAEALLALEREKHDEEAYNDAMTAIQTLKDQLAEDARRRAALIEQWRAEGARIDQFHATMGTGYKVCADELAALTTAEGTQE